MNAKNNSEKIEIIYEKIYIYIYIEDYQNMLKIQSENSFTKVPLLTARSLLRSIKFTPTTPVPSPMKHKSTPLAKPALIAMDEVGKRVKTKSSITNYTLHILMNQNKLPCRSKRLENV